MFYFVMISLGFAGGVLGSIVTYVIDPWAQAARRRRVMKSLQRRIKKAREDQLRAFAVHGEKGGEDVHL
jgi:membrane protein YqaA with SNARE-associated domain